MKSSRYFRVFLYINNTAFAAIFFYWVVSLFLISNAISGKRDATLTPPYIKVNNVPFNGKTLLTKEIEDFNSVVVNNVDSLTGVNFSIQLKLDLHKLYHLNKGYTIFDMIRLQLALLAILIALYCSFLVLDDVRKERDVTDIWARKFKRAAWLFLTAALLLAFGLDFSAYFQNNGRELMVAESNFHLLNIPAAVCLMASLFFGLIAAIKPANA